MFSRSKLPVFAACVISALLPLSAVAGPDLEFDLTNRENLAQPGAAISDWQAQAAAGVDGFNNGGDGLNPANADSAPGAAVANDGGRGLVILQFDRLVSLNKVDTVWVGREFDVTTLPEQEVRDLIEVGWELIGQQVDRMLGSVEVRDKFVSSSWAIGVHNAAIMDASRGNGTPEDSDIYLWLQNLANNAVNAPLAIAEPPVLFLLLSAIVIAAWRHAPFFASVALTATPRRSRRSRIWYSFRSRLKPLPQEKHPAFYDTL